MSNFVFIIISGPPCSGKTTLSQKLVEEFRLPLISKDGIKETLFDSIGWKDREWSKSLGFASYQILFYFAEAMLQAQTSFILEANLLTQFHTPKILALKDKYNFQPFQIQCITDGEVLFERFKQRAESGNRHPGHGEHLQYEEARPVLLKGRYEYLEIGGPLIEVDTTDFAKIDYPGLFSSLKTFL